MPHGFLEMILLLNSLHKTSYKTRYDKTQIIRLMRPNVNRLDKEERRAVLRIWRSLCGIEGCRCSDSPLGHTEMVESVTLQDKNQK